MARPAITAALVVAAVAAGGFLVYRRTHRPIPLFTPLHVACEEGNYVEVERLLNAGADPNEVAGPRGFAPLLDIVQPPHWRINVPTVPGLGSCQTQAACRETTREAFAKVIVLLLKHGADPSVSCTSGGLVYFAAEDACPEILKILVDGSAPALALDDRGQTALHALGRYAVSYRSDEGREDRPNAPKEIDECLAILLRAGIPIDVKDRDDRTPLHQAALEGRLAVVKCLVAHGADVDAKDILGLTPLACASTFSVADFLRSSGAK